MNSFFSTLLITGAMLLSLTACNDLNDPEIQASNKIALENPEYVGTTKDGQKLYVSSIRNGNNFHYVYMLDHIQTTVISGKNPITTVTIDPATPKNDQRQAIIQELERIDAMIAETQKKRDQLVQQLP